VAAAVAAAVAASAGEGRALETAALLDSLQYKGFQYFWMEANPANGLVKDRSTPGSPCSIAAVGFGLSAICVAIDHGWITRESGRDRVLTTLETFWNGPQGTATSGTIGYKGFFYHFLDMSTATRTWTSELSTIDTALLLAGVLDAKQYFSTADSLDVEVRALADSLYRRTDWEFARASGIGIRMGWKPETGFAGFGTWVGYNEAMIMYLLAFGSPTHPPLGASSMWFTWTSGYNWSTQYGYTYVIFPPLFGHQYSHCWIDFRLVQDLYMTSKGITYFENSRRATLAQREYCIANPGGFTGYGADLWGLTASDDPFLGYAAHGAPPAQSDNGTLTPTAPASSIPFAPEVVIPVLHNLYDNYPLLWGAYGFKDAFNPSAAWYDTDYLGIDQGPIVLMIENHLTGSIWSRFMQNADVQNGLAVAGFGPATGAPALPEAPDALVLRGSAPHPVRGTSEISFRMPTAGRAVLSLYDVQGRLVRRLVDGEVAAGENRVTLRAGGLAGGVYWVRLEAGGESVARKVVLVR
jgi:hypothetical protein